LTKVVLPTPPSPTRMSLNSGASDCSNGEGRDAVSWCSNGEGQWACHADSKLLAQRGSFSFPPSGSEKRACPLSARAGLVWFMTEAGKCHYDCVVGTAPLPLQRHPTVPIFAAGSGFESRKSRRNGPWLLSSCGHSRRTLDGPSTTLHSPFSFLVFLFVSLVCATNVSIAIAIAYPQFIRTTGPSRFRRRIHSRS
jgi:hypothetical protein